MPKKVSVSASFVDNYVPNNVLGQPHPSDFSSLYSWFKRSPEVIGIIHAVADDVLGEGFDVVSDDVSLKEKVIKWMIKNKFKTKLYSFLQDALITGNAYFGKINLSLNDVKSVFSEVADNNLLTKSERQELFFKVSKRILKQLDFKIPRELIVLKSSTIRIDFDEHGVINWFVQEVPSVSREAVKFSPSEVIHFSLNNVGDSPYGFSPLSASLNEVAILWYAKDYAGKFFENDASPNRIWVLKNESPDSANYKKFVDNLKKAKNKKHSHIIVTGEVESEKINDFNKDLEFKSLIDKFTQRLMMAWGVPPTRVSQIEGNYKANIEANEGYYKKINRIQEQLEETLNHSLFSDFGSVEIKFRRVYKRDESREADIITKLVGRPVMSVNEARELLGKLPVKEEQYDVIPEKQVAPSFGFQGSQKPPVAPELGSEVRDENKSVEPELIKREKKVISWNMFVKVIESLGFTVDSARVLYKEYDDRFELFFSDSVHEYKTIIPKAEIDVEDFKVRFLHSAIPLIRIEDNKPNVNIQVS